MKSDDVFYYKWAFGECGHFVEVAVRRIHDSRIDMYSPILPIRRVSKDGRRIGRQRFETGSHSQITASIIKGAIKATKTLGAGDESVMIMSSCIFSGRRATPMLRHAAECATIGAIYKAFGVDPDTTIAMLASTTI